MSLWHNSNLLTHSLWNWNTWAGASKKDLSWMNHSLQSFALIECSHHPASKLIMYMDFVNIELTVINNRHSTCNSRRRQWWQVSRYMFLWWSRMQTSTNQHDRSHWHLDPLTGTFHVCHISKHYLKQHINVYFTKSCPWSFWLHLFTYYLFMFVNPCMN